MSRPPTSTRGVAGWLAMTVAVGVCVGVGVHLLDATDGSGSQGPSPRLHGQAVWRAGTEPAPAISLRDQDGGRTTLDSLRGNTVALTFLDTRCHGICAREARALGIAM